MTKVQKSEDLSQGAAAYQTLVAAIRAGDFVPGDRLRETDVALRLNLSRTPVREALRKLEAEGIVEHSPRIGAVIRQLNHGELVQLYEMRMILERTAAEMAAKHAAQAEIDLLVVLNGTIADAQDDPQKAASANQDFHQAIYLAARNRFLLEAARSLNNALMLMGPTTLVDPTRLHKVATEHSVIIQALQKRDTARAGQAAVAHLQTSLRHRLLVLRG